MDDMTFSFRLNELKKEKKEKSASKEIREGLFALSILLP